MALYLILLLASPLAVSGITIAPAVGGSLGLDYFKNLAASIGGVVDPNFNTVANVATGVGSLTGAGLQAAAGVHSALDSAVVNMACDIVNATLHSGNGAIRDVINAVINGTNGVAGVLGALNLGPFNFGANVNATYALQVAAQKVVQDVVTGNILGLAIDSQEMIAATIAALFGLTAGVITPIGSVSGGTGLGGALGALTGGGFGFGIGK